MLRIFYTSVAFARDFAIVLCGEIVIAAFPWEQRTYNYTKHPNEPKSLTDERYNSNFFYRVERFISSSAARRARQYLRLQQSYAESRVPLFAAGAHFRLADLAVEELVPLLRYPAIRDYFLWASRNLAGEIPDQFEDDRVRALYSGFSPAVFYAAKKTTADFDRGEIKCPLPRARAWMGPGAARIEVGGETIEVDCRDWTVAQLFEFAASKSDVASGACDFIGLVEADLIKIQWFTSRPSSPFRRLSFGRD